EFASFLAVNARGKTAAQPEASLSMPADIAQAKALQKDGFQAAGQRFRRLTQELGRGAAQDQKSGRQRLAVGGNAQARKQFWTTLNFIDDNCALQRAQGGVRLRKPGDALRVFQIEIVQGVGRNKLVGQHGFATLSWIK